MEKPFVRSPAGDLELKLKLNKMDQQCIDICNQQIAILQSRCAYIHEMQKHMPDGDGRYDARDETDYLREEIHDIETVRDTHIKHINQRLFEIKNLKKKGKQT